MKTTVIYHRADYDGLFCREAARHWLTQMDAGYTEFIGWDFGDRKIDPIARGKIYILDLPPECLDDLTTEMIDQHDLNIVYIDHHKSSIEQWDESHTKPKLPGYRIDGVAACRLTWQWFYNAHKSWKEGDGANPPNPNRGFYTLPTKEEYIARTVDEPLAIRLAGEYDTWDHRDPRALMFQFGLDTEIDNNPDMFKWMLVDDPTYTNQIVAQGKCAAECYRRRDAEIMRHRSFLVEFEGLKFLALNTARCSSTSFAERDKAETGHNALMGFFWNGTKWTVSLYHAKHNTAIDLSLIATKFGGGGHRGACGFQVGNLPGISNLPFITA